MSTMIRAASALALALSAYAAAAGDYHGPLPPNADDATYFYADDAPAEVASPAPLTTSVQPAAAAEVPREGTDVRAVSDEDDRPTDASMPDPTESGW